MGDERLTFDDVEERSNRLAHHLAAQGIGPGDHVGIYGQNSSDWMMAMMAAFKIRAVPININFRYVTDELSYLFDNADLVALVHDVAFAPLITAVAPDLPDLTVFVSMPGPPGEESAAAASDPEVVAALETLGSVPMAEALAAGSPERDFGERSPDDRYVLYTGGTTGMPKGVVWRHEDVFFALGGGVDAYTQERVTHDRQLSEKAAASPSGLVTLSTPPLMHGAAQWSTLRFWFEGGTVVLVPEVLPRGGVGGHRVRGLQRGPHHRRRHGPAPDRGPRGRSVGLRPLLAHHHLVERRGVLADGQGPLPRAPPERDDHRRHRLQRERAQRHGRGREGRDRDEGRRPVGGARPRRGRCSTTT